MMAAKKVSKKIVVLGDPAVGKTSLIRRFVINAFDDKYLTTIGAKIVKKEVQLRSGGAKPDIDVTLMIWDVAGQKTLGNVKQAYYHYSKPYVRHLLHLGIVQRNLCFDLINQQSFLCLHHPTELQSQLS